MADKMDRGRSRGELSRERKEKRSRSRSYSPKRKHSHDSSRDRKKSHSYHRHRDERRRSRSRSRSSSSDSDSDRYKRSQKTAQPPEPPKISLNMSDNSNTKSSLSFKKPVGGISLKLNAPVAKSSQPKLTVANAFNNDSDEEVEEMPAECKMRMKNIGRMTPTSSGPNSFGKTKMGFVDTKKMFEKKMQEMLKDMND